MHADIAEILNTGDELKAVITLVSGNALQSSGHYFNSFETARNENIEWTKYNPSWLCAKTDLQNNSLSDISTIAIKKVDGKNNKQFTVKYIDDRDTGLIYLILAGIKEDL